MIKFNEEGTKVVIVGKNGVRTLMPNVGIAKAYSQHIWKGKVDKIEITTIIHVEEENND